MTKLPISLSSFVTFYSSRSHILNPVKIEKKIEFNSNNNKY